MKLKNSINNANVKLKSLLNKIQTLKNIFMCPELIPSVIYSKVFSRYLRVEPNWIIYESFLGKSYSDNPKYIYDFLVSQNQGEFTHIWSLNNVRADVNGGCKRVKRGGLRYVYYLAKSKYVVSNMRQPSWYIKRSGQLFLQTWHGTPLKKLVLDTPDTKHSNNAYKNEFCRQASQWDFLVSPNRYSTTIFRRAFGFNGKVLEFGYPRNDPLYHSQGKAISVGKVRLKYKIPSSKKIILYTPTWRDDEFNSNGMRSQNIKLNFANLKRKLGSQYVILLRAHYLIKEKINFNCVSDFVIDVSEHDDVADLFLLSDILLTDYSSTFFDYSVLGKPILFYMHDLTYYQSELRGMYMDPYKDLPGPVTESEDDLVECLKSLNSQFDLYKDKVRQFDKRINGHQDGQASRKICQLVFE